MQQGMLPPYYPKIIADPTGRNGYEEYVMAVDRLIELNLGRTTFEIDIEDGESTRLSRIKIVFDKSHDIARLIASGNRKPVYDPRSLDYETMYPELVYFRSVSRVLVARAEWQYSQGQPNAAVDTTLQLMTFLDSVAGVGGMID